MSLFDKTLTTFRARVDSAGRVLIPAQARQQLRIGQGDEMVGEIDGHGLHLTTHEQALRGVQAYFATIKSDESLVDQLIRERREEATRE